jgi:tripeptide aminopeptidase
MVKRKRLLNRFIKLVKIDSPSRREGKVVAFVSKELRNLGLKANVDKAAARFGGEVGNVWAFLKGNGRKAPKIFLNAHLDTVSTGHVIKPRIKKGYVLSNGKTILGADNKAGVSVILEVLKDIKESRISHGEIIVLFTVAEEIGLMGAKNMPKNLLKADFGLTMDGGDVDEIINQAPSQDNITAEVHGRAAHAGVHPEDGINAIKVSSEAISKMKLGRIDFETTANIGKIRGGVATNIVPEKVVLRGEARSHNSKKLKAQVKHMRSKLLSACKKHKAKLKMRVVHAYRSFSVDQNKAFLKLAVRSAKALKIRPKVKKTGGGSDANIFNMLGIPTIILGAGADRVHTTAERVSVDHMVLSAKLVLKIIEEAAGGKK